MLGDYSIRNSPEILLQSIVSQLAKFKGLSTEENISLSSFTETDYINFLPRTYNFLVSSFTLSTTELSNELIEYFRECHFPEVGVNDIGQNRNVDLALVAKAFCQLLQVPFDLLSQQVSFLSLHFYIA